LSLHDRASDFIPRFAQNGKQDVRLLHLLTHTSGLPDMLPNNELLRRQHQPFSVFIDEICRLPLAFEPGTRVLYQSMGIAILAEIVHQVSGQVLSEFLRREIFFPLGMTNTWLGCDLARQPRVAAIRVPAELEGEDWNWNSPYWLSFGAPWGGLTTTPTDLARFLQMLLDGGTLGKTRILNPDTIQAITRNQLQSMPAVPEDDRRCRPWGLGWRLNWPGTPTAFGDLLAPRAFGHWGSTGTMCWADPDSRTFFIAFTTQPLDEHRNYLTRLSNLVVSAIVR
jgi:CubicO group peptidase (beta-lactamase class C family)